ncbi:uncharacterized protein [Rutidosis leptorrhynchoides]|uniref:uncharacterized protein n=1 Tax=Rutidosis leptorrhynchoides TaxID=125765 RepID=UPI003A9A3FAB
MRLRTDIDGVDQQQIRDFADWILKIGEGKINEPNDGEADVELPNEILLQTDGNSVDTIVNSTYPSVLDHLGDDEENDTWAQQVYSPEVLNGLKVPGVPNHKLTLKRGVPIMLLCNMDQSKGLCNGTRLIVERMGDHTIEARIITGHFFGNLTYIARMVIAPTDRKIAVKF